MAFGHISGAEPSTVTFKAATITQTRNSSVMHQEIISIGDPNSSLSIADVRQVAPASTAYGLVVRIASGPSSGVDCHVSESAGSAFTYGQVGISTAATQIVGANTNRKRLVIMQHSATVDAFVGASTVSATTGLLFAGVKGNQLVFRNDDAIYAITASSTGTLSFVEETH